MKREIKFRAWQDDNMIYQNGTGVQSLLEFYKKLYYDLNELMQFTGLKDKNGKEIFEFDVLRTLHFQTESTINYMFHKVVYDEVRGTFNAINVMNKDEELTTNGNCFLYVALKDKTCELIGNLFETPELLKV